MNFRATLISRQAPMIIMLIGTPIGTGCNKLKKAQGSPQGGEAHSATVVTAADLIPTDGYTLNPLGAEGVIQALSGESYLYSHVPTSSQATICQDEFSKIPLVIDGTSIAVAQTFDATSCFAAALGGGSNVTYKSVTAKVHLDLRCTNGDFSGFAGKTFAAFVNSANSPKLSSCLATSSLIETELVAAATTGTGGGAIDLTIRTVSFLGSADLTACRDNQANSLDTYANNCLFIRKTSSTKKAADGSQTQSEDFAKFVPNNLTDNTDNAASTSNVWHQSGSVGVTYNSWSGTVSYSGSAAAPSYTLSQAGESKPVNGTLSATGLTLDHPEKGGH